LAIPQKRMQSTIVCYLTRPEVEALLECPDRSTFLGRRDHALLLTATQTGLRVSELTALTCTDAQLDASVSSLRCVGKGRRARHTPLTKPTARLLRSWISERSATPADPLFPNRHGGRLSRDAVAELLSKHVTTAATRCPSLASKHITPHVLRHTAAMALLHAGVDASTIALWLGHATTKATEVYIHADLELKEQALARTAPPAVGRNRYHAPDPLIRFLESL